MDPRHLQRIKIIQNLFASTFAGLKDNLPYTDDKITKKIIQRLDKIDHIIQACAPKFPIDKIAKIDLVILRLAIFELVIMTKEPKKVIINEAIELAKEFGGEKSYAFVNGVLGKVTKYYAQQ